MLFTPTSQCQHAVEHRDVNEQDANDPKEQDVQNDKGQRLSGLPFASSHHPQFDTHWVKLHAKPVVPVIIGPLLPASSVNNCYNLFPFSCILPYFCSMPSLLLLRSSPWGDWSLFTCLCLLLLSLIPPALVLHFSTGLSSPLTTSLAVVTCLQSSIQFYDLLLR